MSEESTGKRFFLIALLLLLVGFLLGGSVAPGLSQVIGSDGNPTVLFRSTGLHQRQLAFQFTDSNVSIVCNISRKDEVQIAEDTFKYVNSTSCSRVERNVANTWDNESFQDIYIYERMKQLSENKTKQ